MVSLARLKQLKPLYQHVVNNIVAVVAAPLAVAALANAALIGPEELLAQAKALRGVHVFLALFVLATAATLYLLLRPRPVYLVDYACFRTQPSCRVPFATFLEHAKLVASVEGTSIDERSVRFMTRLLERSGLGEETCLPPAHHYIPPYRNMEASRAEVELVIFSAIDDLLAKTGVRPSDIDVLIVNCSLFAPVPSFTDMIIHRYGMRADIRNVHLSGMGCSAGLISVGLARNLLQAAARGARALVVSTETITPDYYVGKERAMLLPNCLFRMGGAAALLSTSRANARFRQARVVRTLTAAQDSAYRCVFQEEDAEGHRGINLSKDLMTIAGDALKANITAIGPLVLPASEQLLFVLSFIVRKVLGDGKMRPYLPDFRTAFEHLCIHAGGRAVIDELQRSLGLSDEQVEASRMALHRFGNTSSSSVWYELAYIEAKGRMRKGDRVWMIGFGSGFKCNSAAWECIAPPRSAEGPWADSICRYPVDIPEVVKH
jgi:3-ketoacyl-CoA synthase